MAGWLAKFRLAWRDLWAQGRRSIFFALLVASGVASLVGVQGMARSMEANMRGTAQQLIQGDIVITKTKELTQEQRSALQELEQQGAQMTESIQAMGHVQNAKGHTMFDIKVVDLNVWPYYGGFKSSPEGVHPGKDEALVGPELLTKLKLQVGDSFDLEKDKPVKIVGTVLEEPMPLGDIPSGPRVLLTKETWPNTSPGNSQKVMLKLPESVKAADAKAKLVPAFAKSDILSAEESWNSLAESMDNIFTFLSMVALISLLVGGLGVAMAMRTFISQKLEHIAVLKALGASSGTVMSVFLLEAAMLGVGGSVVGAGLGMGLQLYLPKLFEGLVPIPAGGLNWMAALGGLAAGVAIAVLSALVPVRAIRAIKPVALFRGETGSGKIGWKALAESLFVGLITLAGVAWLAVTYAKSTSVGLGFLGGLLATTLVLFLISWVLMRVTRLLPQSGRPATRHAVRSLNAPGNQSAAVVMAMGLGIMLMTTLYLVQNVLITQIKTAGAGPETPNLYIMSFKPENSSKMVETLEKHPKVNKVLDRTLVAMPEVVSVDGKSPANPKAPDQKVTEMVSGSPAELPKNSKLVDGTWFTPEQKGQPYLSVNDVHAKSYDLHVGSTVVMRFKEQPVTFTVSSIWTLVDDSVMMPLGNIAAAPGTIDQYADQYMVTVVTRPHEEERVGGDVLEQFPEAMPVSLEAYLKAFETVLNRITNILRFLTAFAVVAAGVILSGSLSATRFRRRKEAALLKSLGATRFTVAAASALENGLLGIVAGLTGGGLAFALVQAGVVYGKIRIEVPLQPLGAAALAGGLLAVLVGVGSTLDVLQVKPLSVLRSE